MSKWKSMKTAPIDGTPVLLRLESGNSVVGSYEKNMWQVSLSAITDIFAFSVMSTIEPTHWCQIPPTPPEVK